MYIYIYSFLVFSCCLCIPLYTSVASSFLLDAFWYISFLHIKKKEKETDWLCSQWEVLTTKNKSEGYTIHIQKTGMPEVKMARIMVRRTVTQWLVWYWMVHVQIEILNSLEYYYFFLLWVWHYSSLVDGWSLGCRVHLFNLRMGRHVATLIFTFFYGFFCWLCLGFCLYSHTLIKDLLLGWNRRGIG